MLKFLATTENARKIDQKIRVRIAGKLLKSARVKLLFEILLEIYVVSRAILFLIGDETAGREKEKRLTVPE